MAGYSDNILAAPDYLIPGEPDAGLPVQDVLLQYAPGAALHYLSPRIRVAASYMRPYTFYVEHPGADNSSDVFKSEANFGLSPYDELEVGLDIARYTTNMSTLKAPNDTAIVVQPGGTSSLMTLVSKQQLTHEISDLWSWLENGDAGVSIPLSGGSSLFAGSVTTGPQLALEDHAFALLPTLAYTRPLDDDPLAAGYRASEMVLVGGRGRWHWVFAPPEWSLAASGGALAALDGADTHVEPIGGGAFRFLDRGLGVSVHYDHGYVPNLITGQTYFSDTVSVRGEIPIVREAHILLRTSSGVAFSQAFDVGREIDTGTVKTFIGDAAVGWYPELYPQIEIRYQHTRQWDAPRDQLILPNFRRNVIGLMISYMWPPLAATLPKGHSRKPEDTTRESMTPIGEE